MEDEKKEKLKIRKGGNQPGTKTQKMMSFRVDNEVAAILRSCPNKGRFLNDLVRRWWVGKGRQVPTFEQWSDGEWHPDESSQPDYWLV